MHCSKKHQNVLRIKRRNLLCRLVLDHSNATSYVYAYIMLSTHGRNRSPTVWVPYAQEISWCHLEVIAGAVNPVLKHCNFGFGRCHLDLSVLSLFNPSKRYGYCFVGFYYSYHSLFQTSYVLTFYDSSMYIEKVQIVAEIMFRS